MSRPQLHPLHLHRTAVWVLLLSLVASGVGSALAYRLVGRSEHRLLQQKGAEGALVLSALMGQYYGAAAHGLAAAVRADGTVDQHVFAPTAAAITQATGASSLGVGGAAILDTSTGRALASGGTVLLNARSASGLRQLRAAAEAAAASNDPSRLAFSGLVRAPGQRALGMVVPAGASTVAYLELTIDNSLKSDGGSANQPFSGLDFAVYYGHALPEDLIWTNVRSARLPRSAVQVSAGASATATFQTRVPDPSSLPLLIRVASQSPLTGRFAQLFPWLLLTVGLLSGLAVVILTETTQRRRDEACALVAELEARNAEVSDAVHRQSLAEEKLRQAQRLEAVGQLAGGVAHDFNNLLAVMFSYLGFLRVTAEGQPWLEDVEEVEKAAQRAAQLTQQLLMFGRRDLTQPDVIDMRDLIADRCKLLQRTLGEDIEIVAEIPDHALLVRADAVELDQVVMNLAVNARDAMPQGGVLRLHLDQVTDLESPGDRWVRLRVGDTGLGMDDATLQHAFEPFFTTKDVGRGTGLGLATVYGIATRWGGTVTISTAPGMGCTVTVLLPHCTDVTSTAPGVALALPGQRPGRREGTVLLVEDDPSVRVATRRILVEAGFSVLDAADGNEALDVFATQDVDVLVSDVVMPGGLSGPDLADRLRVLKPGLQVILSSGYDREHLSRRGPLPEGTRLLRKPFPAATLIEAVSHALLRPQAASS